MIQKKGYVEISILIAIVCLPLLLTFHVGGSGLTLGSISIILGIIAYGLLLIDIILSLRIKKLDKAIGLTQTYRVHGLIAFCMFLMAIVHVVMLFPNNIFEIPLPAGPFGISAVLLILICIWVGIHHLSKEFFTKVLPKPNPKKRERGLLLHRLAIIATLLAYGHIVSFGWVRNNVLFVIMLTIFTFITMILYIYQQIKSYKPKAEVVKIERLTPSIHRIELKVLANKNFEYKAGQYAFLRFIDSKLPKESHPFSMSSYYKNEDHYIEFMIKESGNYTSQLHKIEKNNQVALNGPYGNFFEGEVVHNNNPLIFLGGGIGVTPLLSVIRQQIEHNSTREMYLIMGLSKKEDIFYLDKFKQWDKQYPNFTFHIIFSSEEVDGYESGYIDGNYLKKLGIDQYYSQASFLICGPEVMMNAVKQNLLDQGVSKKQIHLEKFSF